MHNISRAEAESAYSKDSSSSDLYVRVDLCRHCSVVCAILHSVIDAYLSVHLFGSMQNVVKNCNK